MCSPLLFITFVLLYSSAKELDFSNEIDEGEKYYMELKRKSQSYGECWKRAISNLHIDCKQLTEEVQSRLALSFANCFLKHAGFDPCVCSTNVSISDCFRNCSDRVFSTYTEFFTHTQSVCHYLQHKEWHFEIVETALLLTKNSQKISKKLDESAQSQSKILDLQRNSLTEQRKALYHGKILSDELMRSRESARNMYNEFKITTYEQKLLLFDIFDRMKNLQNFVLGEFTGVYTFAYYLVIAILVYLLTSVSRTANARIWLILIFSANAAVEKLFTSYALQESNTELNPELLYHRIWLCRKAACIICVIILIISYYRYKDYNAINNQLLREIQQQNMELQNFIKGLTFHENIFPAMKISVDELFDHQKKNNNMFAEKSKFNEQSPSNLTSEQVAVSKNNDVNCESNFTTDSPYIMKKTPKKKVVNLVKKSYHRKENTVRIPLKNENILSNLESPNSPTSRYNLRSSNGLSSPLSSL